MPHGIVFASRLSPHRQNEQYALQILKWTRKIASEMATRLFPARWTRWLAAPRVLSYTQTINAKHSQHVARILPIAFIAHVVHYDFHLLDSTTLFALFHSAHNRCSVIVYFQIKEPQKGDRLPLEILYSEFPTSCTEYGVNCTAIGQSMPFLHRITGSLLPGGIPSLNHLCETIRIGN